VRQHARRIFAFIQALWAPRGTTIQFGNDRPSPWNDLARKEIDLLHEFVQREVVPACDVIRGNNKKVVAAALDLLEHECQPLKDVIRAHLRSNEQFRNGHPLNRLITMMRHMAQHR
jgi:hypothetical protein